MTFVVTGVKGQFGYDVMNGLEKRGRDYVGYDIMTAYASVDDGRVL